MHIRYAQRLTAHSQNLIHTSGSGSGGIDPPLPGCDFIHFAKCKAAPLHAILEDRLPSSVFVSGCGTTT